jgi:tripartite-type tricarboxylate transporter receptor subunit TctC
MPGSGGRIASQFVYDADPDGYTLLATNASDVSMGEVAQDVRYKTEEFTYIGTYTHEGAALIASKDSGITSVEELVAASKIKPINYGAVHLASQNHMCSYFLAEVTGMDAKIIPYSGGAPILADLMGNHIQVGLVGLSLGVNAHNDGRVTMLAQLSETRSNIAKDFPAIKEAYPDYKGSNYTFGVMAPPNVPEDIQAILVKAYQEAVKNPEFLKWADSAFLDINDIGPEAFEALMVNDKATYSSLMDIVKELKTATEAK